MRKLVNFSFLILISKLIFSPCQCMEEVTVLDKIPNEMILTIYESFPKIILPNIYIRRYVNDPDKDMNLRNTIALVCSEWHQRVVELTDHISFPKSIGPLLFSSFEDGGIRIPEIFQNIVRLDANGTIPIKKGIIDDILNLKQLKVLSLTFSNTVTDDLISRLTGLETLKLVSNLQITDKGLMPLTGLKRLKLCKQDKTTGSFLQNCTNLMRLRLGGVYVVTTSSLLGLTKLDTLSLKGSSTCESQDEDLMDSFHLQVIGFSVQSKITVTNLVILSNLTHLTLDGSVVISQQALDLFDGKLYDTKFTRKKWQKVGLPNFQ